MYSRHEFFNQLQDLGGEGMNDNIIYEKIGAAVDSDAQTQRSALPETVNEAQSCLKAPVVALRRRPEFDLVSGLSP